MLASGHSSKRSLGSVTAVAMSGSGSGSSGASSVTSVVRRFLSEYSSGTPSRLKVLDAYLLYVMLTGALQFGYCLGVGTFPFNSFLSGFISAVGSFILGGEALSDWVGVGPVGLRRRECPRGNPLLSRGWWRFWRCHGNRHPPRHPHWRVFNCGGRVFLCRRGNVP